MLSTLLIVLLILILLGGVGFVPAPAFTPEARGVVGAVILVFALVWLFRFSGLV